jgi:predicted O-linked N-acetylglucosamine transferase (SPINDLY family)
VAHHRAGRLQAAEQSYRQILKASPDQPVHGIGLGVLAYQVGQHQLAFAYLGRALTLRPTSGAFHSNFGLAALALRQFDQAVAAFHRAAELLPGEVEPIFNLGNALKEQKKLDEACSCYRRALELKPQHAGAHNNLGNALRELGQLDLAVASYRRALAIKPDYAEAYNNLANALRDQGNPLEAEACCHQALALRPDFAVAYNNLGNVLKTQGRKEEAEACYRRALSLTPGFAEAHSNLGDLLLNQGKLDEAVACHRKAVESRPEHAEAHASLGNTLMIQGHLDEGDACYRRALEIQPSLAAAHSAALLWKLYRPKVTLASLAADHAEWDRLHGHPAAARSHQPHAFHRPLRLGFVSPDFGRHPVGYFAIRAIEALPRDEFDVTCYSTVWRNDDLTARFRSAAKIWREVRPLPDEVLAGQIAADGIDVLFDLAGHSAGNRLGVFAHKPVPIQITWIGSEGTTGLAAMDYLLADELLIPSGSEAHYRERILRMPRVYVCYDPPREAPPVGPLPALGNGYVTFGSFNNPAKIHAEVVAVWARILRRVQRSRLVLKYRWLTDAGMRRRILEMFTANGVEADRLELSGWSSHPEMLAQYNSIDLALDPFPFAGGATTCEALWMGVPVLTCPGDTFASRHSLSYLSAVGLTGTIARNLDEYVELAVACAEDLSQLATARAELRTRLADSPLCDGPGFAADLAAIVRELCAPAASRPS